MNGKKVPFTPTKLKLLRPVPSDIEIAQAGKLKPILQIAAELGIREKLELFGPYKARSTRSCHREAPERQIHRCDRHHPHPARRRQDYDHGRLEPGTRRASGKASSRSSASRRRDRPSASRAAAGGGYSQIIPMEDFNLHLTGDIHAITAHTTCAPRRWMRASCRSQQDDEKLFNALCPANKKGERQFSPTMLRRSRSSASTRPIPTN